MPLDQQRRIACAAGALFLSLGAMQMLVAWLTAGFRQELVFGVSEMTGVALGIALVRGGARFVSSRPASWYVLPCATIAGGIAAAAAFVFFQVMPGVPLTYTLRLGALFGLEIGAALLLIARARGRRVVAISQTPTPTIVPV